MNKQREEGLKGCQKGLLEDEKILQQQVSNRMEKLKEKCSEDYWEIGHDIELSLAEQHIISVLDEYLRNEDFDAAEQYFSYMFREFKLDLPEDDIVGNVSFIKQALPVLMQIKVRKSVLKEIEELIMEDIEDFQSIVEKKKDLFLIERELAK